AEVADLGSVQCLRTGRGGQVEQVFGSQRQPVGAQLLVIVGLQPFLEQVQAGATAHVRTKRERHTRFEVVPHRKQAATQRRVRGGTVRHRGSGTGQALQ